MRPQVAIAVLVVACSLVCLAECSSLTATRRPTTKRVYSPTKRFVSATKRYVTATKRYATATKRYATATKRYATATKRYATVTKRYPTATKRSASVTKRPTSPTKRIASLTASIKRTPTRTGLPFDIIQTLSYNYTALVFIYSYKIIGGARAGSNVYCNAQNTVYPPFGSFTLPLTQAAGQIVLGGPCLRCEMSGCCGTVCHNTYVYCTYTDNISPYEYTVDASCAKCDEGYFEGFGPGPC
mmetsp:Transcript_32938/g.55556  ORF Transcript_32938/g.55556 Transcript_32938/m.55556 type:complete len:241 (-) Transcript_32938:635-1357(-)